MAEPSAELAVKLVRMAKKYGYLKRACRWCGQQMVVARSGKRCLNCGRT